MEKICVSAQSRSQHSGRSEINLTDILPALEAVGMSVTKIREHVHAFPDIPFPTAVPEYPVTMPPRIPESFETRGETNPAHIPSHLPVFPDAHTYQKTSMYAGNPIEGDQRKVIKEVGRTQREGEKAVVSLHQQTNAALASLVEPKNIRTTQQKGRDGRNLYVDGDNDTDDTRRLLATGGMSTDRSHALLQVSSVLKLFTGRKYIYSQYFRPIFLCCTFVSMSLAPPPLLPLTVGVRTFSHSESGSSKRPNTGNGAAFASANASFDAMDEVMNTSATMSGLAGGVRLDALQGSAVEENKKGFAEALDTPQE